MDFPDEKIYLEKVNGQLDAALAEAEAAVGRMDAEYTELKHYMSKNRGELDPHEMFRSEQELGRIDVRGAFTVRFRDKIARLKDSPYFARIDFGEDGGKTEAFYIGRFAFDRGGRLFVSDWRSPVAGMFYDCEPGPASYKAPAGVIAGQLTRKRQFKIKNGVMEYALESSENIRDDILQRELSHTSDEKMKSIISTIQKEQNKIIRNDNAGTLIIQGVAGSGKTSIALHRVAFLLYRHKSLSARNVTILSPNRVFGDYISNVLPELGEEPVFEASFADIARVQLEGIIGFEPDKDPLEAKDRAWDERAGYKSTLGFVKLLDEFIAKIPDLAFEPADCSFGRFAYPAEKISERYAAYGRHPVLRRLEMIADDIYDRFATDNFMEETLPSLKAILSALKRMLKIKDVLALYKEFYRQNGKSGLFRLSGRKTLEWPDVYPYLYIRAAFAGLRESGVIRHLVIDEMQDYTPVQYAVINRLFKCRKTILGDFGQYANPVHRHTLEDLLALYGGADFAELKKSYRSTYEIISFAKKIKSAGEIEAVERHGEEPALVSCSSREEELLRLKAMIKRFGKSGYASLGIIAKTDAEARRLCDLLSGECDLRLISPDASRFENGVSITSVRMSKGLEFDEVIVYGADRESYGEEYDRGLLYIACTRAMHRLSLTWTGEKSPLIPT